MFDVWHHTCIECEFSYVLLCSFSLCQKTEHGSERQREEIVSWIDAVIVINPLDGVTAGHPQPSAACFLSKQDCLT